MTKIISIARILKREKESHPLINVTGPVIKRMILHIQTGILIFNIYLREIV